MEKEFVPYELALTLKQLNYPQNFDYDGTWYFATLSNGETKSFCWTSDEDTPPYMFNPIIQPTYSQAFRWFREKYELFCYVELVGHRLFDYVIIGDFVEEIDYEDGPFNTHEEAELECLKKIIEIVKTK